MSSIRDTLIETAADSLRRQGYTATGLNEILQKSGAPKGSLYHYFPQGKEQLAVEALSYSTKIWFKKLNNIMQKAENPAGAIQEICKDMAQDLKESDWQNGCPIATVTLEVASTIVAIQKAADLHWKQWHQAIANYFSSHGYTISDKMINTSIAAFEGGLLLARAYRSEEPLLQVGELLADLFSSLNKNSLTKESM